MSKINFLVVILISAFFSACGFHTPHAKLATNAVINAPAHNKFADTLKKHLNPNIVPSFNVQIGNEVLKQHNAAYNKSNQVSGYNLSLSVPIQVFDRNKKPLLIDTLVAKSYIKRIIKTQSDKLQIAQKYQQLRNVLAKKLLRKLSKL